MNIENDSFIKNDISAAVTSTTYNSNSSNNPDDDNDDNISKQNDNNNELIVINVYRFDKKYFFIWDTDDIQTLRNKYRLVGCLMGLVITTHTLGGTIPLILSIEEALLGSELGWLRVIDQGNLVAPLQSEIEQFIESRQLDISRQVDVIIERKRQKDQQFKELNQNNPNNKKKNKKQKIEQASNQQQQQSEQQQQQNEQQQQTISNNQENNSIQVDNNEAKQPQEQQSTIKEKEKQKQQQQNIQNYEGVTHVKIFTSIKEAERYADQDINNKILKSWRERREESVVTYDQLIIESASTNDLERYRVLKDLWSRGYYLTSGSKFGGTFLAYPGDPLLHHSELIVMVRSNCESISSRELTTMARLAVSVNKTTLLATVTPIPQNSTKITPNTTTPSNNSDNIQPVASNNNNTIPLSNFKDCFHQKTHDLEMEQQQHCYNNHQHQVEYLTLTWEGVT